MPTHLRLRDRSTSDLLLLMVAGTVCAYVIVLGSVLALLAFFTDRDLSNAARNISDIVNTLIGLLAGFLAGRTERSLRSEELAEGEKP